MKYRKRPIVIEAKQYEGAREDLWAWLREILDDPDGDDRVHFVHGRLYVSTLEGRMLCERGDWLIRGVMGELYPCKPDIFETTYELVDE